MGVQCTQERPLSSRLPRWVGSGLAGGCELEGRDLSRAVQAQRRAADAEAAVHVHEGPARAKESARVGSSDAREVQMPARRREGELAAVGVARDHEREAEALRLPE